MGETASQNHRRIQTVVEADVIFVILPTTEDVGAHIVGKNVFIGGLEFGPVVLSGNFGYVSSGLNALCRGRCDGRELEPPALEGNLAHAAAIGVTELPQVEVVVEYLVAQAKKDRRIILADLKAPVFGKFPDAINKASSHWSRRSRVRTEPRWYRQ